MKRFIKYIFIFGSGLFLYALFANIILVKLLSISYGPSTKEQIMTQFDAVKNQNYELCILGSSRTYRGINPALLSIKSYNFSHDNDAYNQMYYKLRYLIEERKNPDYLILDIAYTPFTHFSDTRNYIYADYFSDEYMRDYSLSAYWSKFDEWTNNMSILKLLAVIRGRKNIPYLTNAGQYILISKASPDDFT